MGIVENWKKNKDRILYISGAFLTALIVALAGAGIIILTVGDGAVWRELIVVCIGAASTFFVAFFGYVFGINPDLPENPIPEPVIPEP